ncbi:hypothetical protein PV328_001773 [Microctonus aethiopoides]|uniref:Large ribosomal subunit protein mL37 n=1 Tax=Microctonus aethiopoides TaxID=144406 RepID=A0AA39KXP3_9HYME|nr:hypothetical protein PV328_001773 [Microctonus aethiopoides]
MKLTQALWNQHLGRMIKRNWFAHGKQILGDTLTETALASKGIEITDAQEFLKKPHAFPRIDPDELFSGCVVRRPLSKDEDHPDWKKRPCMRHNNYDLLVQGVDQAQLLTKTLIVKNTLPDEVENLVEDTTEELDNLLTKIIYSSSIFDAQQVKLPKKKDPLRPAWIFARDYGINDVRKSYHLAQKMIQVCESLCGLELAQERQIIHNGLVQLSLEKENELLIFNSTMDMLMMSTKGLKPMESDKDISHATFPDIYPLSPVISLHSDHFYQVVDSFPVSKESPFANSHTLFVIHDCEKVKNFTELPVTENQLLARSLTKSFIAAAACAKQKFGNDVKDLPEPITIQCVQTNGRTFHLSVFQLNTLNIDGIDGKCNLWWSMPQLNLYEKAEYENSKPIVTNYNPEVFKRILAFYKNN